MAKKSTASKATNGKKYTVKKSNIAGEGAFAKNDIAPGEHIGKVHTIIQPYVDYDFTELGHKHNHSENPNVQNVLIGNERHFFAIKPIKKGDELTSNYRLQPDLEQPEDFKDGGKMTPQKDGYRWYSPYKDLPYITVDSNAIDTNGIVHDLMLLGDDGTQKFVKKNTGTHILPDSKSVTEYPVQAKTGGWLSKYQEGGNVQSTSTKETTTYLPYRVDYTDPKTGKPASKWYESAEDAKYFMEHGALETVSPSGVSGYYEKSPGPKKPLPASEQKRLQDQAVLKNTVKDFYDQWYNSPMHEEMLRDSLNKGTGLFLNKRVNNLTQDRLDTIDNKMDLNLEKLPQDGIFEFTSAGNVKYDRPELINISPFTTPDFQKGVSVHEGAHVTDQLLGIPKRDIKIMKRYADFNKEYPQSLLKEGYTPEEQVEDQKNFRKYVSDPTETRARIMNGRYELNNSKIYNPFKEKLTKEKFEQGEKENKDFKRINDELRSIYTDDQILDLYNKISKSENNQEQTLAQYGTSVESTQGGLTDQGFDYNSAWGGQFQRGGDIPKAQYGRATRSDSLALLNNTMQVRNYYQNTGNYQKDFESFNKPVGGNAFIDALNKDYKDFLKLISSDYPTASGKRASGKLSPSVYRRDVDANRFYQRESANAILDTRAPMSLFDRRIEPTSYEQYTNINPNDIMHDDGIAVYGYDPLSVTPWDMLNPRQRDERVQKFGLSGTPYKNREDYIKTLTSIPIRNHKPKPPAPKPYSKKELTPVGLDFNKTSTTPTNVSITPRPLGVKQLETPGSSGRYRVEYFDPETKQMTHRNFASEKEAAPFRAALSKQGATQYGITGYYEQTPQFQLGGNVYPTNYVPQAQNGLKQYISDINNHGVEKTFNKWLGNPMGKAEQTAEANAGQWFNPQTKKWEKEEQADNFRHPLAGMYTSQAIAKKFPTWMQYTGIPNAAGFIGSNILGVGHEIMEPNRDKGISIWQTIRNGAEDAFNNAVGAGVGSLPFLSNKQKEEALKYLSDNNWLPDGIVTPDGRSFYKHRMGGSIPGSAGFTYARTGSIPSNGKYAKKTLASAQRGKVVPIDPSTDSKYAEPISKATQFTQNWMNSPMYHQMLMNSVGGDQEKYDKINNARLSDINKGINYVEMGMRPDTSAESFTKGKGKSTIAFNRNVEHPHLLNDIIHEMSHITDRGGINIPLADLKLMERYAARDVKDSSKYEKAKKTKTLRDLKGFMKYVNIPTETRARIQDLRESLYDQGAYDPFTQPLTKEALDKYKRQPLSDKDIQAGATVGFDPLEQLRLSYSDEEIMDMMNKISKADNNQEQTVAKNGMSFYQHGLDWKPKTISRDGGWLNKYREGGVVKAQNGTTQTSGEYDENTIKGFAKNFKIAYDGSPKSRASIIEKIKNISGVYDNLLQLNPINKPATLFDALETLGYKNTKDIKAKLAKQYGLISNESEYNQNNATINEKLRQQLENDAVRKQFTSSLSGMAKKYGIKSFNPTNIDQLMLLDKKMQPDVSKKIERYNNPDPVYIDENGNVQSIQGTGGSPFKDRESFINSIRGGNYLDRKDITPEIIKREQAKAKKSVTNKPASTNAFVNNANLNYIKDLNKPVIDNVDKIGTLYTDKINRNIPITSKQQPASNQAYFSAAPYRTNAEKEYDRQRVIAANIAYAAQNGIPVDDEGNFDAAWQTRRDRGQLINRPSSGYYIPQAPDIVKTMGSFSGVKNYNDYTAPGGVGNIGAVAQTAATILPPIIAAGATALPVVTSALGAPLLEGIGLTEGGWGAVTANNLINLGFGYEGAKQFVDPNSITRQSISQAYNNPTLSNIVDATGNSLLSGIGVAMSPGFGTGLKTGINELGSLKNNLIGVNLEKQLANNNLLARQIYGNDAYQNFLKYGPTTRPDVPRIQQLIDFAKTNPSEFRFASGESMNVVPSISKGTPGLGNGEFLHPYFSEGKLWYNPQASKINAGAMGKERVIVADPTKFPEGTFARGTESNIIMGEPSAEMLQKVGGNRRVMLPYEGVDNPSNFQVYERNWLGRYNPVNAPQSASTRFNQAVNQASNATRPKLSIAPSGNHLMEDLVKNNQITLNELNDFARKEAEWIQSDEYVKRRSAATGESEAEIKTHVNEILHNFKNNTKFSIVPDLGNAKGEFATQGFANGSQKSTVKLREDLDRETALGTGQHEIIHAFSPLNEDIHLPNYMVGLDKYPVVDIGHPLNKLVSRNYRKSAKYLSDPAEQNVRNLKLLDFIQETQGVPRGQQLTDENMITLFHDLGENGNPAIKNKFYTRNRDIVDQMHMMLDADKKIKFLPGNILQGKFPIKLRQQGNFYKTLKDALNKAYVVPGIIGTGAAGAAASEAESSDDGDTESQRHGGITRKVNKKTKGGWLDTYK